MIDEIAFAALAALTIVAAIVSLEAKQVVYGAVALAFTFLGLAGLFIGLDSIFVAMFQIIVNIGAVAVLILFTVMLVGEGRFLKEAKSSDNTAAGVLAAIVLAVVLIVSFGSSQLANEVAQASVPSSFGIGSLITSQFALTLEVLALVFGAALLGALTLAKLEVNKKAEATSVKS